MKILIIVFSLLGIGLHLRMLGFLVDPQYSADFAVLWEASPLSNRVLTIGAMLIPFAFYAFCGLSCFVRVRSWPVTLCGVIILMCAVPWIIKVNAVLPSVARNAFLTAMFSIPYYFAKPKTRVGADDAPSHELPPDRERQQGESPSA
jgi:hypothetical protein